MLYDFDNFGIALTTPEVMALRREIRSGGLDQADHRDCREAARTPMFLVGTAVYV